jgi:uncharacterized protein
VIKIVFDLVLDNKLRLYISPTLTKEVLKKLIELKASSQAQSEASLFLIKKGVHLNPQIKITVCRDPKDNFILELAESAKADYIITRDKDLLELPGQKWKETVIIKPEAFLPMLRKVLPKTFN